MNLLKNKIVLVTGGTGSFGSAVVGKLVRQGCRQIRIFSRDELKQELMRKRLNNDDVKFYIGDVRDRSSVDGAMKGVDIVFHAAALKQVPSCEFFPMQAVMTNIVGASNVIESAIDHRVSRVICLSTDKAVYPINAMGMTKALMEKKALAASRSLGNKETIISCVRYGNVMCSRGSVIPLFIRQIKESKPMTVTDPAMTRFLLSLEDAISLVLFALTNSRQGDIFIKKAPACTILDLAKALKKVYRSGVPIRTIGIRHGEKVYETLATSQELRQAEDMRDYFRIGMDDRDLNYNKYFIKGSVKASPAEDYTSHNTRRLNVEQIARLLGSLPEVKRSINGPLPEFI